MQLTRCSCLVDRHRLQPSTWTRHKPHSVSTTNPLRRWRPSLAKIKTTAAAATEEVPEEAEGTIVVTEEAGEATPMGQVPPQGAQDTPQSRTAWQTNCAPVTTPMQIKLGTAWLQQLAHGRINVLQDQNNEGLASLTERIQTK